MTILEAKFVHGTMQVTSSIGDTLSLLVRRLYKSDDIKYYKVLKTLNNRFDWQCIEPGSVIEYLPESVIKNIEEI